MTIQRARKDEQNLEPETTKVRLSLTQLWTLIAFLVGSVSGGTYVIVGLLYSIRESQSAMRTEFVLYQQKADTQIKTTTETLTELRQDRAESLREWWIWRNKKDSLDATHDSDIRVINQRIYGNGKDE